ncbi:MAG: hypothetical protein ACRDHL_12955, partial [Candidatus Promineifilaceae bacterium]
MTFIARAAPWTSLAGAICSLLGLAWDAWLHRQDPGLAAHEGLFSLSNPGHVLLMAGLALVVLGGLLFLLGRLARPGRPLAGRLAYAAGLGLFALCA